MGRVTPGPSDGWASPGPRRPRARPRPPRRRGDGPGRSAPTGEAGAASLSATYHAVVVAVVALLATWLLGPGAWDAWSIPVGALATFALLALRPVLHPSPR